MRFANVVMGLGLAAIALPAALTSGCSSSDSGSTSTTCHPSDSSSARTRAVIVSLRAPLTRTMRFVELLTRGSAWAFAVAKKIDVRMPHTTEVTIRSDETQQRFNASRLAAYGLAVHGVRQGTLPSTARQLDVPAPCDHYAPGSP